MGLSEHVIWLIPPKFSKSQKYNMEKIKIPTYCGSHISVPDIRLLLILKISYSNLSVTNNTQYGVWYAVTEG